MAETLAEHLRKARAARDPDNLRHACAEARAKRKPPKPCDCDTLDGKHKSTCPEYLRQKQRESRARKSSSPSSE